ncbi:hypothetical protein Peur_035336 [Populus x canadensis]
MESKRLIVLNSHCIVGDEGGFAPNIQENKEGLELLKTAIAKAGYTGRLLSLLMMLKLFALKIIVDVAASEFYNNDDKTYDLNFKEEFEFKPEAPAYESFCCRTTMDHKRYLESLKNVYKSFVTVYPIVQFVGDDLLVTNPKVNQIGSVTESIEAVKMSKRAGWGVVASQRSGET